MATIDPELSANDALGLRRLPDVDAVQAFVVTAQCGSMRAAAADMNTSPTSIRRAVARLERHVEGRLFTRTRAGVRLTALGRAQLVNAQRAVYILGEALGRPRARTRPRLTKRSIAGYC